MEKRVIGILDLADETLMHIFTYIPAFDLITLSSVCPRFHQICCEKAVVHTLDFRGCYHLTESAFKTFFKPRILCNNVRILNLNYCYWLPSTTFAKIGILKNLKELHILDCYVSSFVILEKVLRNLNLESLSWTWNLVSRYIDEGARMLVGLKNNLTSLRCLVLRIINIYHLVEVCKFLSVCQNLEEFEIYFSQAFACKQNRILIRFRSLGLLGRNDCIDGGRCIQSIPTGSFPLEKLKRLKFHGWDDEAVQNGLFKTGKRMPHIFYEFVSVFANTDIPWKVLWITENGSKVLCEWCKNGKLTLDKIVSVEALNLSGSRPLYRELQQWDDNDGYENNDGYEFSMKILRHEEPLKCRKLSLNRSQLTAELLFAIAQKCPNLENLSMAHCSVLNSHYLAPTGERLCISDGLKRIADNCLKITHLDLTASNISANCSVLAALKDLVSLGIPTTMLTTRKQLDQTSKQSGGQQQPAAGRARIGVQTEFTVEMLQKNQLWVLAEACPRIVKLAIVDTISPFFVNEMEYTCISQFKNLQRLYIFDRHYLHSGHFLIDVLKACSKLVSLHFLSPRPHFLQPLVTAFAHAKSLEDLCIFRENLDLPYGFYDSLSKCSNLRHLRLSAVHYDSCFPADIDRMVARLPKLTVLFMFVKTPAYECTLKDVWKRLERHSKVRPGFIYFIEIKDKPNASMTKFGPPTFPTGFAVVNGF